MKWTHIIWDWNGTLLNDTAAALNAVNQMLLRRHLPPLTKSKYRDIFGFPVRDFYKKAGFTWTPEEWNAMAEEFHTAFRKDSNIQLHPHAREVLCALQTQNGIRQSILSACEITLLKQMVADQGIAHFFDQICGVSDLNGASKLHLGKTFIAQMSLHPRQILLIGDTLHDAEVARALGTDCVLISAGHQAESRLQQSNFPVLQNLRALLSFL